MRLPVHLFLVPSQHFFILLLPLQRLSLRSATRLLALTGFQQPERAEAHHSSSRVRTWTFGRYRPHRRHRRHRRRQRRGR